MELLYGEEMTKITHHEKMGRIKSVNPWLLRASERERERGSSFVLQPTSSWSLSLTALSAGSSVSLAGFAAHLSEVGAAAELELQHQWTVRHLVYIFAL